MPPSPIAAVRPLAALALALLLWLSAAMPALAEGRGRIRLLRDAELEALLAEISAPLAQAAGIDPQSLDFTIVEDPRVNAYVAGGQRIFLNSGLLLDSRNPQELLGVIAHELGHIAGGHIPRLGVESRQIARETLIISVLQCALATVASGDPAGCALGAAAGEAGAAGRITASMRVKEASADEAAVEFLTQAGMPIDGLVAFLGRLGEREGIGTRSDFDYLRTHPGARDRARTLTARLAASPGGSVPADAPERLARIQAKLLGYVRKDAALRRFPASATGFAERYGRAVALWRSSELPAALDLLRALQAEEPRNPYLVELEAQILLEAGQAEASAAAYARAAALLPDSALILGAWGQALLAVGTAPALEEATRQLSRALQLEPGISGLHRALATAYGQSGDLIRSRLHLAEEALIKAEWEEARSLAEGVKAQTPFGSALYLRAEDLVTQAELEEQRAEDRRR